MADRPGAATGAASSPSFPGDPPPHAHLWPDTARLERHGRLLIAGLDAAALASTYGTPRYVYDEATFRSQMRAFRKSFARRWPASAVALRAGYPAECIHLPMASNYTLVPRPAVVFVRDGRARLVRRRETMDDLTRLDLP